MLTFVHEREREKHTLSNNIRAWILFNARISEQKTVLFWIEFPNFQFNQFVSEWHSKCCSARKQCETFHWMNSIDDFWLLFCFNFRHMYVEFLCFIVDVAMGRLVANWLNIISVWHFNSESWRDFIGIWHECEWRVLVFMIICIQSTFTAKPPNI